MMHRPSFAFRAGFAIMLGLRATAPAHAETAEAVPPSEAAEATALARSEGDALESGFSFSLDVVSDYRFRGVSLSDRKRAVQAGIEYQHATGLFAGAWGSTIADYEGAEQELDLYVGYSRAFGPVEATATLAQYLYPGGKDVNYLELSGELATAIGAAELSLDAAFVPDQRNTAGSGFYLGVGATHPLPVRGLSIHGHIGREAGVFGPKLDWSLGLSHTTGPLTVRAEYVGSDFGAEDEAGRAAKPGVMLGVGIAF